MLFKKKIIQFTCADEGLCEKWVNSIKHVQENINDFIGPQTKAKGQKDEQYANLQVYCKVTGKCCFKDYDVLCEKYEQRTMMLVWLASLRYLEDSVRRSKTKRTLTQIVEERALLHPKPAENKDETGQRHEEMMEMEEFNELMSKVNPNQIDFYEACFGAYGSKGTLCEVVDKRAMDMVLNRKKNGMPLVKDSEAARHSEGLGEVGQEGRTGGQVKQLVAGQVSKSLAMQHDDDEESDISDISYHSSDYDSESYDSQGSGSQLSDSRLEEISDDSDNRNVHR